MDKCIELISVIKLTRFKASCVNKIICLRFTDINNYLLEINWKFNVYYFTQLIITFIYNSYKASVKTK